MQERNVLGMQSGSSQFLESGLRLAGATLTHNLDPKSIVVSPFSPQDSSGQWYY